MIAYRDFVPQQTEPRRLAFLGPTAGSYESLAMALAAANEWLAQDRVQVLNVETVVLPNVWEREEEGTADLALRTRGDVSSYWHQFIRIWYQTP
jgi:hypothetical protein